MSNGSLDKWLYPDSNPNPLPWARKAHKGNRHIWLWDASTGNCVWKATLHALAKWQRSKEFLVVR